MISTTSANTVLDELLTILCHGLQITDQQHRAAELRYQSIGPLLERQSSPLAGHGPSLYPQGSLCLGTTVKPRGSQEFDLDIVCELMTHPAAFPYPPVLISGIADFLRKQDLQGGRVSTKKRCVRISYPEQFHIDILPACQDSSNGGTFLLVPDRTTKGWTTSNPRGFSAWFRSQCNFVSRILMERAEPIPPKEPVHDKPTLKLATQLLKRWRDEHYQGRLEIAPISIVLTTLAGTHYEGAISVGEALRGIIRAVIQNLPSDGTRLLVVNPANPLEDLSERWDKIPGSYEAFVAGILELENKFESLMSPQPLDRLATTLGELFGTERTKVVFQEYGRRLYQHPARPQLRVQKHSGILSRSVPPVAVASSLPVRHHTFYGE